MYVAQSLFYFSLFPFLCRLALVLKVMLRLSHVCDYVCTGFCEGFHDYLQARDYLFPLQQYKLFCDLSCYSQCIPLHQCLNYITFDIYELGHCERCFNGGIGYAGGCWNNSYDGFFRVYCWIYVKIEPMVVLLWGFILGYIGLLHMAQF